MLLFSMLEDFCSLMPCGAGPVSCLRRWQRCDTDGSILLLLFNLIQIGVLLQYSLVPFWGRRFPDHFAKFNEQQGGQNDGSIRSEVSDGATSILINRKLACRHAFVVRSSLAACPEVEASVLRTIPPTTPDSTFAYLEGHRLSLQISTICLALYKSPARPVPLSTTPPLTYNPDGHGQLHACTHALYFPVFAEDHVTSWNRYGPSASRLLHGVLTISSSIIRL